MNHLKPAEILETLTETGVGKANGSFIHLFTLGIMAGAYIAFAGAASNMAAFNLLLDDSSYGLGRVLAATVFTGGFILVTLAGAELFTGNSLMTIALAGKRITLTQMIRNWAIVYIANLMGSIIIAFLIFNTGIFSSGGDMLGTLTVKTGAAKVSMTFLQCFLSGILCNWLVCLAVWCTAGASSTAGKAAAAFFPIWLFATGGYEHCVANMYFIPAAIFASSNGTFAALSGAGPEALSNLTWQGMFLGNILPVTLGNLSGGIIFVAMGYWIAIKGGRG